MALQFKIQICGITKPPVWRRVIVPETFTFERFHYVIQAVFGWDNSHLYEFSEKGNGSQSVIGMPSEDDWTPVTDSSKITLKKIFKKEGQTYIYLYDFGDSWQHSIKLEKITDDKISKASCVAGKGVCPPEDCGGVWGYEEIKNIFAFGPESDEANEFREWLGLKKNEIWDPNTFDLAEANNNVRKM